MSSRKLVIEDKEFAWGIKGDVLTIWNKTDNKPVGKWEVREYEMVTPFTVRCLILQEGAESMPRLE